MILTAKFAGADDTLADYKRHLEERAQEVGPKATLRPPTFTKIEGRVWVDAILTGSEIANYDTRYLATVKDQIAVVFTFSAHRSVYEQVLSGAVQAVNTLQVIDDWKRDKVR
jgi:hypothetical protein